MFYKAKAFTSISLRWQPTLEGVRSRMSRADIIIGGDVCPTPRNEAYFRQGDSGALLNDLLPLFKNADLRIVNLECPLIDRPSPIFKRRPVLGTSSQCINGLIACGIDILCLANNHNYDHGRQGLYNTLETCRSAGIEAVGAGRSLQEARHMLVRSVNGLRLGIIAMAQSEFSIASEDSAGAAPLDAIDFIRHVRNARGNTDHVIVIVHGGNEYYPYPSPRLMQLCRFMIEEGASAVICQHSHCPGCYEEYDGGIIVYGQGNLLFDAQTEQSCWWQGFLIRLSLEPNAKPSMDIIPYTQSKAHVGAKRMDPEQETRFLRSLEERSTAISDRSFVLKEWAKYCDTQRNAYYGRLCRFSHFLGRLGATGVVAKAFASCADLPSIINVIRCEAHREALLHILEDDLRRRHR